MTISNHKKMFSQLKAKPVKLAKFIKHNTPLVRKCGKNNKRCILCGNPRGRVMIYNLGLCRRCFKNNAKRMGFKKYN